MGRAAVRRDPTPKAAHERVAARAVRTRDIPLNLTIVFKLVFVLCRCVVLSSLFPFCSVVASVDVDPTAIQPRTL